MKVESARLVAKTLVVFVKKEHQNYVTALSSSSVSSGILGIGSTGGVSIRFNLHQTSLCFISSHLSPHSGEFQKRNQDYSAVTSRLKFQVGDEFLYFDDHDLVYWLGDLNYRLNKLTSEEVKKEIELGNLNALIKLDQLKEQQELGETFVDYCEAPIGFLPTYKFDIGTDRWDTSAKNRAPAWCDRILWKGDEPSRCIEYRSHPELRFSDHRPVSALFDTSIKVADPLRYEQIREEAKRKLSESDGLLQISVDKSQISFGSISFRDLVTDSLTITNTGSTSGQFEIVQKPKWLNVKPTRGVLINGQKRWLDIEITVDQSMPELAKGNMSETLVVVLKSLKAGSRNQSSEIQISLVGNYRPSSFGSSIECLVHLRKPINEYSSSELATLLSKYDQYDSAKATSQPTTKYAIKLDENLEQTINNGAHLDVPKELMFLVNEQLKRGLAVKELFGRPGLRSEFVTIREAADRFNSTQLSVSFHSVAESILFFLDSFTEPVIPYEFHKRAVDSSKDIELCKQVSYQSLSFMTDNSRRETLTN